MLNIHSVVFYDFIKNNQYLITIPDKMPIAIGPPKTCHIILKLAALNSNMSRGQSMNKAQGLYKGFCKLRNKNPMSSVQKLFGIPD